MFVTAAAVVTMQPQELHSSWYREYSAQPRDDASQLRDKRHKLLLLKQVTDLEAHLCHASAAHPGPSPQGAQLSQAIV